MAPLKPVKRDVSDKRVQNVLDKSIAVSSLLQRGNPIPASLEGELENLIKTAFPNPAVNTPTSVLSSFDSHGCEIWNASTNIIRDAETQRDPQAQGEDVHVTHITILLRVFAFMLVDFAYQSYPKRHKDQDRLIRNLKVGLKACKSCLDKGQLDIASGVIERCGRYVAAAADESPLVHLTREVEKNDTRPILHGLTIELCLVRLTYAWKTERLDLAEHFYGEFSSSRTSKSSNLIESGAELLHQIGKSLLKKKHEKFAKPWLQRATKVLDSCDPTQLSQDAFELRLAISTSLVNCLITEGSPFSLQQAQGLVEELDASHGFGNRIAVQLLQLKILLTGEQGDEEKLSDVLLRIVRSAVLSDQIFNNIMKAIHRVRKVNIRVACRAIGELITDRLLPDLTFDRDMLTWIEKGTVTYTLFVISESQETQNVAADGLEKIYDVVAQALNGSFPPRATHATQALIWKAAGGKDHEIADRWLQMLRHPLFDSAGQINKAKIGRKAMTSAMARGDLDAARQAFFQIPGPSQSDGMTCYLAFKLAIQSNDYQLATESLSMAAKRADREPTILYACVLETQESHERRFAVAALQAILDKVPPNVHFPSLLRCTAKLLVGELENQDRDLNEVMEETLRVFESAVKNKKPLLNGNNEQWRAELQWWTKNSYNIALRYCGQIYPEHLVRMLRVCTQLMESHPNDDGPMHRDGMKRRSVLCHFLSASAFIVLARSHSEESEGELQSYLEARREIAEFMSLCTQLAPENDGDRRTTLHRLFEMLKLDLECVIHLQQWDQLDEALKSCLELKDVDRWDTLADIALVIQRKISTVEVDSGIHERLTKLLQKIINDTWKKQRDMAKASRWLRISFSHDLKEETGTFALNLLTQAADMARKGYERKTDPFSELELQWLSTTAFNKAVDLLSSGEGKSCGPWLDGALELARYSADNGALHANLTSKRQLFEQRLKKTSS